MKRIILLVLLLVSSSIYGQLLLDSGRVKYPEVHNKACPPNPTSVTCNVPFSFNLNTGFVGNNPSIGNSNCNPCCYAGSDLDCDGEQDVSFSVENSEWFEWCNPTASPLTVTVGFDEPGSGNQCNIQGAVWVGSSLNSTTVSCSNSEYQEYGSNPGGNADGFSFTVTVSVGECAYFMVDGYAGSSCTGVEAVVPCPAALPVELEVFEGINKGYYNSITWVTATETNNSHFTLERSRGGEFWEYLETIVGAGTVNTPSLYEYKDYSYIDGVNYYRLIQTDYDGSQDTSQIISIRTIKKPDTEKPIAYDTVGRVIIDPEHYIGVIIYKYKNGFWYKVTRLK